LKMLQEEERELRRQQALLKSKEMELKRKAELNSRIHSSVGITSITD